MNLTPLEGALGYRFKSPELLQQAVTHRSFSATNNERLEFLGDSVLNFVVAEALFSRFPELSEGALSRLRANLVRQESLAEISRELSIGPNLRLGEGERKSGGSARPSILADALEAMLGAVHCDSGFDEARNVTLKLFASVLAAVDPGTLNKDAKTMLQEFLQGKRLPLPGYELVATRGEAHAQEFEVQCRVAALNVSCHGIGSSRRAAEQAAAAQALKEIGL